jgi:hypothetical protein
MHQLICIGADIGRGTEFFAFGCFRIPLSRQM